MADLGTNVDKIGTVQADSLHWLHSRWARIVAAPDRVSEQLPYIKAMRAVGIKVLLCFDNDAYRAFGPVDDPRTWRQAAQWGRVVYGGLIEAIEPTNEPDGEGFESSQMPVETVNGMIVAHREVWGWDDMIIVGAATSSGQASYYQKVRIDLLNAISAHFYAQWSPAELTAMIDRHAALGMPLWITEIGLNAFDAEQAAFMDWTLRTIKAHPAVKVCTWFCAHPYGDWGMSRADGTWRPSAEVFRRIAPPLATTDGATFQLGFKKWHDIEPELIGNAVTNEQNVYPEWQSQATTRGVLNWVGGKGHAFTTHDGHIFRWSEDWSKSEQVA